MRLPGHPPFASLLFAPLTLLSFPSAALVWTVGSILLLVAVLAWLRRELRLPLRGPWFGVVLALLPLWHPVWYHLHVGQLTIVLFALLVGAWSLEARGRPVLAGCLIGVAVTLKVFPALFLVYALVRKRWRLVGAGLATCTGLILAQTALNPAEWPAYLLEVAPANEAEWLPNPRNDSLASLSFRLFVGNAEVRPFIAAPAAELPARVALYAMAILLQVAWLWRSRRRPDRTADHGLCLSAMVLLSPLTWDHAIVFLLFPFAELWRRTLQGDGGKSRGPMVAVVLALVVSVFPAEVVYVNLRHSWGALPMPAWVHFHAAGLAVVLLGFGATLAGLWHLTRHEGGTQHRGSAPGPAVD